MADADQQATPAECCPGCGRMSTKVHAFEKLKERLNERRKSLKRELEKLEMDLNSLDELKIKSKNAARLYNSGCDEIGKALLEADEAGSDPALLDELQMKAENAAMLYNSSIDELEEAMSKIKADFEAKNKDVP